MAKEIKDEGKKSRFGVGVSLDEDSQSQSTVSLPNKVVSKSTQQVGSQLKMKPSVKVSDSSDWDSS